MAQNEHINKVIFGSRLVCDLSNVTITPDTLAKGYTAHVADGSPIVGTFEGGSQIEVSITSYPTVIYHQNDTLDLTNLKISAYSDGYTKDITNECIISPSDGTVLSEIGSVTISIKYKSYIFVFRVFVDYIPTWTNGDYDDIYWFLQLHYSGAISIYDYWNVGDEREIELSDGEKVIYTLKPQTHNNAFDIYPKYVSDTALVMSPYTGAPYANTNTSKWMNGTYYDKFPAKIKNILLLYKSADNQTEDYFSAPTYSEASSLGRQMIKSGTYVDYWTRTRNSSDRYYIMTSSGSMGAWTETLWSGYMYPIGAI